MIHRRAPAACEIKIFNRGRTSADMFPDLEEAAGRSRQQPGIAQGPEVGCVPGQQRPHPAHEFEGLGGTAGPEHPSQYVFISSISVYARLLAARAERKSPVSIVTDERLAAAKTPKDITGENYGALGR
ncbi:MAG: hypothetical protein IPH48_18930 [bacterium]|nr:hypothetical protein [bacterium]